MAVAARNYWGSAVITNAMSEGKRRTAQDSTRDDEAGGYDSGRTEASLAKNRVGL
jgi:hypothetical protein